ncbi:hypothetical protein [Mycolicibacterium mucogenicum]|uniref:Uncharacterized protein n=1 Tax=Mycolicibacterium mucogenicum DSM 44124 TaxID=1226753 RepID=A0A8H2JI62_MYCMU|nr:hypothetical protein [Mycolicibacterium mucogenicum]KAB7752902.1 hypothetical protein MMUC44124_26655 [Mycolicibacterium mucogenicum DSM 44124]QPG69120.1 hypothetical protein C1S78_027665 [Mycolicibacterium mucogenicum DSM 44124]
MITVRQIADQLDALHTERLDAAKAAILGAALAGMECTDLLRPEQWPAPGWFSNLTGGHLVFTNVRGVYVGLDPAASIVYKVECPIGTWWETTYSADHIEDQPLKSQTTLERAQLRCEQHRRLHARSKATAVPASGG